MAHSQPRIYTFDLLRGLAVLTMMLAHSVYFFHSRDSHALIGVENFGNTVSFITFVVVSGAVTWVAMFSGHRAGQPVNRRRVATRVGVLLLAYYLLALLVSGPEFLRTEGFDRLRLLGNLLSFRTLPGFMEYFPPFIFYSAAIGFFPRLFWTISQRFRYVLVASAITYGAGLFLAQTPTGPIWAPWVALIAGGDGLFRFPLLQYFPVFFLGLFWGHQTVVNEGLAIKRQFVTQVAWLCVYTVLGAYLITTFTGISPAIMFERWPPSIPFLALGLAFAFIAARWLYQVRQLRSIRLLRDVLLVFGQNALGLFWSHIFLLKLYEIAGGQQVSSPWLVIGLFILLVIITVALTTFLPFNFRLALTAIRGSHEEHEEALEHEAVFRLSKDIAAETQQATSGVRAFFWPTPGRQSQRTLRRRHRLGLSFVAIVTAALIFPVASEEIALQRQERGADIWWSSAYAYRQPLTLENTESFVTLPVGATVAIRLNHQALVAEGKSRADGHDLALVYWTGDKHAILKYTIAQPDTDNATLTFRAPAPIEGKKPEQFYALYYGGFPESFSTSPKLETTTTIRARFGLEESYPLVAHVSSSWNLIGQPDSDTVTVNLTSKKEYPTATVSYKILETDLAGTMLPSTPTSWEATLPVANLEPGTYHVQATVHETSGQLHTSQITGFTRSHPLYVAWTWDWEGYDTNQKYLEAMEAIANQYQLPITHFFNPRVFITEKITPARAQTMVKWLQRRLTLGDGFGLHLHLFLDFVEQAGVKVRTEPNWGDSGDGYGVPLSAYTAAEQETLIKNANNLLFANGLPQTTMFRAGGWYANLDTLKALEATGFTVDSSARTKYQFGRNRLPGHWDISATMKPYYPSRTNQNVSGTKNFSILEIPDNGADSYAYSAQAMVDRFTANLGSGVLAEPQQVTFLSHPHWFDEKEQARVRELFEYVSHYDSVNDFGPVIFTKTEAIAELWSHAQ